MYGSMVDIQSTMTEIRPGKKKEDRNHRAKCPHLRRRAAIKKKVETTAAKYKLMACPILWAAIINKNLVIFHPFAQKPLLSDVSPT